MTKLALSEKSTTRTVRSTQSIQSSPEVSKNVFLHFSLQDALPSGHILVINRKLGTLSHIAAKDEQIWLL